MARRFIGWVAVVSLLFLAACTPPPFRASEAPHPSPGPTQGVSPQPTRAETPPTPTAKPTLPPSPKPTEAQTAVGIGMILQNPEAFRDAFVRIQGHGLIMATVPLCPGHVGLDTRQQFVDAEGQKIVAITHGAPSQEMLYDAEKMRLFEGYIRIFQGMIGCPGSAREETVPYFEITAVKKAP